VVLFDVNKRCSFESALSTIVEHKKASSIDHVGSKMPIMLVGTKSDVASYKMQSRIQVVGKGKAKDKEKESSMGIDSFISEEEQRSRAERYNITLNVCIEIFVQLQDILFCLNVTDLSKPSSRGTKTETSSHVGEDVSKKWIWS
jgi:hypothetical protein